MSKHKIIIEFNTDEKDFKYRIFFKNKPSVDDVITAFDEVINGFNTAIQKKLEKEQIKPKDFDKYLKKLKVIDLNIIQ